MQLRPYQVHAVNNCLNAWHAGNRNLLVVAAVGAGKTVIAAHIIEQVLKKKGGAALFLAHREELLHQTLDKLKQIAPGLSAGLEQGSHRCPPAARVMVASIASIRRIQRLAQWRPLPQINLVVVDEAHHATSDTYVKVLEEISVHNPQRWLLGITATPIRMDGENLSILFERLAYRIDMETLIEQNYLCPLRGYTIPSPVSLKALQKDDQEDYPEDTLEAILNQDVRNQVILEAYQKHGENRPAIVFLPGVKYASHMAQLFRKKGIPAEALHGKLPQQKRQEILVKYQKGEIKILTNCGVLIEGFDAPHTACIIMARPTKSPVLYPQAIGRGLRLHPAKKDCCVLDIVDMCSQAITLPQLFRLPEALQLQGESLQQVQKVMAEVTRQRPDLTQIQGRSFTTKDLSSLLQPPDFIHLAQTIQPHVETPVTWFPYHQHYIAIPRPQTTQIIWMKRLELGGWKLQYLDKEHPWFCQKHKALEQAAQQLATWLTPKEIQWVSVNPPCANPWPKESAALWRSFFITEEQINTYPANKRHRLLQQLSFLRQVFRLNGQIQYGRYLGQYYEMAWLFDPDYMENLARRYAFIARKIQPAHVLEWLQQHKPEIWQQHDLPTPQQLLNISQRNPGEFHGRLRQALKNSAEFFRMQQQYQQSQHNHAHTRC